VVWGLKVFTHGLILYPQGGFGHIYTAS
jgi:hypothetical protein